MITWERSPDRTTWVASAGGVLLAVSRSPYGWKGQVRWHPWSHDEHQATSRYYASRKTAQRWAERQVAP